MGIWVKKSSRTPRELHTYHGFHVRGRGTPKCPLIPVPGHAPVSWVKRRQDSLAKFRYNFNGVVPSSP